MTANKTFKKVKSLETEVLDIDALKNLIKEEATACIAEGVTEDTALLEALTVFVFSDDYVCNVLELDLIYQTAISCNASLFEEQLLQQTLEIKPTDVYDTRESLEKASWITIIQTILLELNLSKTEDALAIEKTPSNVSFRAQIDLEHQLAQKGFFDQDCAPDVKVKKLNGVMREILQTAILIATAHEKRVDITEIRNHVYDILRLSVIDLQHTMKCKRDQYWRRQVSNGVYYLKKDGAIIYDAEYKNYRITEWGLAMIS